MLLFEESQNAMNTGYSDALPMNRKAYDIYVETAQNGLGFLKTYPEKWRLLLGEDQVKEKAGSAELQHSVVMEGTMTLDEWLDQE